MPLLSIFSITYFLAKDGKKMKNLTNTLSRMGACKVLVIGDFILDTYTHGKASRISPEAPVAVVRVEKIDQLPGGAGNVILNLVSLGAEVIAVGRVGHDQAGDYLQNSLLAEGINIEGLFRESNFATPVKNRVIAANQQVVRIDYENIIPLSETLEDEVIAKLDDLLQDVQVIAISDYGKGFLSRTLISAVIEEAESRGILVIVDPKGSDFSKYRGAKIIKPNLSEAILASGLDAQVPLDLIASKILENTQSEFLMVTRSEAGISIFQKNGESHHCPAKIRDVKDVTGAGDTVLAILSCALANGLSMPEAAYLCNVAAGIAIEHSGCARVTLSQIAHRLLETDMVSKVFDSEHLFALQEVLKGKPFVILGLDDKQPLSLELFTSIRKLWQEEHGGKDILVYIRSDEPDLDFVNMLASLHEIQFIILNSESLRQFCFQVKPSQVFSFEDQRLKKVDFAHQLF